MIYNISSSKIYFSNKSFNTYDSFEMYVKNVYLIGLVNKFCIPMCK